MEIFNIIRISITGNVTYSEKSIVRCILGGSEHIAPI